MSCLPIGVSITNLDFIGVIEDEEIFGKLSDDNAIRLCLLLALKVIFMGHLLTFNVDDTLFNLVENIEACNSFPWGEHLWCHLYDEIKNLKERHGGEHYYGLFKDRNYAPTYTLSGFVFAFQIWILETFERCESWWIKDPKVIPEQWAPPIKEHRGLFETYLSKLEKARKRGKTGFMGAGGGGAGGSRLEEQLIIVLSHERSDRQAKLKFTDEFSSMTSDLCDSLNSMFADLIEPADPDEDIGQDYLREEELRLCLEGEEKMRCEHQKLIIEENRIRLDESKTPAKRIQLCSSSEKIQPKVSWVKIKKYRQQVYDPCTAEFLKTVKPWVELVRDTYVSCQHLMVRCEERHEQILELQNLVGSTVVAECVRLLQKFQQDDLESSRGMMRLICETQLKVQLPVVLERANIFQKNGIDPSKYTITLVHGLSLDVDDPIDVALAREDGLIFFKHKC
ncbi:hypothetical protein Tco_1237632 [Tanacetum coccineum]